MFGFKGFMGKFRFVKFPRKILPKHMLQKLQKICEKKNSISKASKTKSRTF